MKYIATKIIGAEKIVVKIKLHDDCRNGHFDFSITADISEKRGNNKFVWTAEGCCHNEILNKFPKFKQFVNLHLSDFRGVPMYAIENGFYHLRDKEKTEEQRKKIVTEYLRCTEQEFYTLDNAGDKLHFQYLVESVLNLPARWQQEASAAIAELEKLSGETCPVDLGISRYEPLTTKQIATIEERIRAGYYTEHAIFAREQAIEKQTIADVIAGLDNELEETCKAEKRKTEIKKTILLVAGMRAFKNTIYYGHSNKVVFNWQSYGVKLSTKEYQQAVEKLRKEVIFSGVNFELDRK